MMRWGLSALVIALLLATVAAEELITTSDNSTLVSNSTASTIESPWAGDSKVCVFVREWILKGVFMVITVIFLVGVAVISGAAFPEWRNHGSQMIIGAIVAALLYVIGMPALKLLTGVSVCGLG